MKLMNIFRLFAVLALFWGTFSSQGFGQSLKNIEYFESVHKAYIQHSVDLIMPVAFEAYSSKVVDLRRAISRNRKSSRIDAIVADLEVKENDINEKYPIISDSFKVVLDWKRRVDSLRVDSLKLDEYMDAIGEIRKAGNLAEHGNIQSAIGHLNSDTRSRDGLEYYGVWYSILNDLTAYESQIRSQHGETIFPEVLREIVYLKDHSEKLLSLSDGSFKNLRRQEQARNLVREAVFNARYILKVLEEIRNSSSSGDHYIEGSYQSLREIATRFYSYNEIYETEAFIEPEIIAANIVANIDHVIQTGYELQDSLNNSLEQAVLDRRELSRVRNQLAIEKKINEDLLSVRDSVTVDNATREALDNLLNTLPDSVFFVYQTSNDLYIEIRRNLYIDDDMRAEMRLEYYRNPLDKFEELIRELNAAKDKAIHVEVHTGNKQGEEAAQRLSEMRAAHFADYLYDLIFPSDLREILGWQSRGVGSKYPYMECEEDLGGDCNERIVVRILEIVP